MPQPVDMQSELNRVAMAERIQEAATRLSSAAQHRVQLDAEDDERANETIVKEAEEISQSEVAKEGRRKNPFVQRRKKKKRRIPLTKPLTSYTPPANRKRLSRIPMPMNSTSRYSASPCCSYACL